MTKVSIQEPFEKLGDNLIELGNAIKSPYSTIEELTELSAACGLRLQFRVTPQEPQE